MNRLPEPTARQPHAPQAGQPTIDHQAQQLINAVEDALQTPTAYRDPSPIPTHGPTPPVTQPGRPPMSQRAVDVNTTILSTSVLTAVLGGSATAVLWASGHADPTVIGYICAAPAALAIPVLALSRLAKRAKETVEAAPPVIHQHYNGTVIHDERTVHSKNTGLWASTRNQLPPGHDHA